MAVQSLNILIFQTQESGDSLRWGAQALEYDVFAEGDTITEAMDNFSIAFAAELAYCGRHGLSPSSIGKAPRHFREMAERAANKSAKLDTGAVMEKIVSMLPKTVRGGIGSFGAMVMA